MTRKKHIVFFAEVVNLFGEVFEHERLHAVPIFIPKFFVAVFFGEQKPEPVQNVLAVFLFKIVGNHRSVGGCPTEILRLVGEKAFEFFREVGSVARLIFPVR